MNTQPRISLRYSICQCGPYARWAVYDNLLQRYVRIHLGWEEANYQAGRLEMKRDRDAEPDEYPAHEREASEADRAHQLSREAE